jgi:hypothetical protein
MSLLREYIRELLTEGEGAKTSQDFIRIPGTVIRVLDGGDEIEIYYDKQMSKEGSPNPRRTSSGRLTSGELEPGVIPWGDITIGREDVHGPCGGAFMVGGAVADHGWGPLLYDVAMEYATLRGGGMFADRTSVTGEARKVWAYYLGNRGDVTAHQMDDLENTLTPDIEEDNCDQFTAAGNPNVSKVEDYDTDWVKSPLSKRYTKPPTTIDALRKAGRLKER